MVRSQGCLPLQETRARVPDPDSTQQGPRLPMKRAAAHSSPRRPRTGATALKFYNFATGKVTLLSSFRRTHQSTRLAQRLPSLLTAAGFSTRSSINPAVI